MPATLQLARIGGTTGEWAAVMREVFGEFRAPTGVAGATSTSGAALAAVAARHAGIEVIYSGIRLTLEQIAASAGDEDPDVIGLSILSGSHMELVPELIEQLRTRGVNAPVMVGGIIPEVDRQKLLDAGVAAVYTPKDFELAKIMHDIVDLTQHRRA